jgi:hypothetical protein
MDKDKIIQSLLKMLQKEQADKINMQISIDDLTEKLNAVNAVEEKKEKDNDEESDLRAVQTEKPN